MKTNYEYLCVRCAKITRKCFTFKIHQNENHAETSHITLRELHEKILKLKHLTKFIDSKKFSTLTSIIKNVLEK